MTIKVYHILFDEGLIAETGIKDKIDLIIEEFIEKYKVERKSLKKELEEIEEAFKDVYAPRKNDTLESYNKFVMETYPELYRRLEKVGQKILKGQHFYCWMFQKKDSKSKRLKLKFHRNKKRKESYRTV